MIRRVALEERITFHSIMTLEIRKGYKRRILQEKNFTNPAVTSGIPDIIIIALLAALVTLYSSFAP